MDAAIKLLPSYSERGGEFDGECYEIRRISSLIGVIKTDNCWCVGLCELLMTQ